MIEHQEMSRVEGGFAINDDESKNICTDTIFKRLNSFVLLLLPTA